MEIQDEVYGTVKFEEPVLAELIRSEPVQRLKDIHQSGPQPFFMDEKPPTIRYSHSLGVMLLLRKFEAPIEEQIAGLLHDVPHTAFSHTADFVFENEDHEYHDSFLEKIVLDSEIPGILERHGIDTDYVLDESNHRLLERDAPDLCADRIDYFLRDVKVYSGKDISHLLEGVTAVDNRFVLKDKQVAEDYALKYIEADEEFWANPKEMAVMKIFAEAVREAFETGIIEEDDLFGTDQEVLRILRESENPVIQQKLSVLDEGFDVDRDREDYDVEVKTKARSVDPQVKEEGMRRISELSEKVDRRIKEHVDDVKSGYRLKLV